MRENARLTLLALFFCAILVVLGVVLVKGLLAPPPPVTAPPLAAAKPKLEPSRAPDAPTVRPAKTATEAVVAQPVVEEETADTGPGEIRGSVLNEDGQPVSGALVEAFYFDWMSSDATRRPAPTATAASDTNGRYELLELPCRRYLLKATTEGAMGVEWTQITDNWRAQEVDIRLKPGWTLEGTVSNPEGQPVAGALVSPVQKEIMSRSPTGTLLQSETDEGGTFVISHLPRGKWQFLVEAEGYPHLVSELFAQDVGHVDLVLGEGGSIAGRAVLADSGEPVPGLEIVAAARDWTTDQNRVKTDAQGAFLLPQLRPAEYQLGLRDEILVLAKDSPKVKVTLDKEVSDIVLEVATGGVVSGMVRDAGSGVGIAGAKLNAYPDRGVDTTANTKLRLNIGTDAEGRYRITGLPKGQYRLQCDPVKGYKSPAWQEYPNVSAIPGQEITDVNLDLTRTPEISGRVEDAQGSPVAGAQVEGQDKEGYFRSGTAAGADGRFSLSGFGVGVEVTLAARKDRMASKPTEPLAVGDEGLSGVVLVLDQPMSGSIEGMVVDGAGRPRDSLGVMAFAEGRRGAGMSQVTTDEAGRFKVLNLAAGSYYVQARDLKTYGYSASAQEQVVLKEGEHRTGIRLVYDSNTANAISGRVTDVKGQPIERAGVTAHGPSYAYSPTEADGTYTLTGLSEGSYYVMVNHASYTGTQRENVPAGSKGVDFKLEGTGAIEGQVVNAATGQPITRFSIGYSQGNQTGNRAGMRPDTLSQASDPDGHFMISNVPVGEATVFVRAAGFALGAELVPKVAAGQTVGNIRIALKGGGRVEGLVTNSDGVPINGVKIFIGNVPSSWERTQMPAAATTGGDGKFVLDTVSPEDNRISAYHPGYAVGSAAVTPQPNKSEYVEIVLAAGGRIEGTISSEGQPIAGVYISAQKAEILERGDSASGSSDDKGFYRLSALADGDFMVQAYWYNRMDRDRSRSLERTAVVEGGQVTVVDFTFAAADSVIEGLITVNGKPAADAHVSARILSADGEEHSGTKADGQGLYRIEPVPAGYVYLTASVEDRQKIVELELASGQTVRQDIAFGESAVLFGTVTGLLPQAENGVALLNGRVSIPANPTALDVLQLQRLVVKTAAPEANGSYRAEDIEPGLYTVAAYSVPPNIIDLRFSYSVLELQSGSETALDFVLE